MEPSLPTQKFVEIKEVKNSIVYLKKGGLRKILIVSGINFDLKSEEEQEMILGTFQNFLNGLDFPIQFFIHSRKVNIESYLERMLARKNEETNELLKIQIAEYVEFIKSFVEQNAIIDKAFFVIVPYEPLILVSEARGFLSGVLGQKPNQKQKENTEKENAEQLEQRVSQVTSGLGQIGLRTAELADDEMVELFYNLYNPQLTEKKNLEATRKQ
ncbi:MAG: hypothetical protein Q7R98_01580 [Candidatus Jorgensenbacteria bacterium]|nr:hypothetical protein [Candidatus Jorgensenbacteria bacterium]